MLRNTTNTTARLAALLTCLCVYILHNAPDFPLLAHRSGNGEFMHLSILLEGMLHTQLCCFAVVSTLARGSSTPELRHHRLRPHPPQLVSRFGEGGVYIHGITNTDCLTFRRCRTTTWHSLAILVFYSTHPTVSFQHAPGLRACRSKEGATNLSMLGPCRGCHRRPTLLVGSSSKCYGN